MNQNDICQEEMMSLAKRLYLSISRLREPRALRMVVGITIALSLLMDCATQKAVSGDVTAKFISLRSERTDSLTKKREEWKQANEAFNKRFESDRKKLDQMQESVISAIEAARNLSAQTQQITADFDKRMTATEEEWQRQIEQNDQNLTRRVSEEMIKQEAEFAEHRRTCGAVRGQIGVLIADHEKSINVFALLSERIAERMGPEDRPVAGGSSVTIPPINVRKVAFDIPTTVSSWVDWAQVLIERGALKAVPPDVEDLLELNSAALKERETSEKSPQKVFLVRAMRNYKSAIERLQKDSSTLPSGWQPVWDAEKTLLAYSGDRPASRRWMEEESFRVALANKAYVYDALIRLRGGMTETYDRFEMAYYLSQMIWCARKLGHPFADEIETLANTYLRGLSENRALAAN